MIRPTNTLPITALVLLLGACSSSSVENSSGDGNAPPSLRAAQPSISAVNANTGEPVTLRVSRVQVGTIALQQ